MKRLILALAFVAAFSAAGSAHKFEKNGILIKHPWTRATAEGASVGVGYLTITNNGKEADKLTGGTFEGAATVEVHEMKMDGDKMLYAAAEGRARDPAGAVRQAQPWRISSDVRRPQSSDSEGA